MYCDVNFVSLCIVHALLFLGVQHCYRHKWRIYISVVKQWIDSYEFLFIG